jgi:hypothetical protein
MMKREVGLFYRQRWGNGRVVRGKKERELGWNWGREKRERCRMMELRIMGGNDNDISLSSLEDRYAHAGTEGIGYQDGFFRRFMVHIGHHNNFEFLWRRSYDSEGAQLLYCVSALALFISHNLTASYMVLILLIHAAKYANVFSL